jgi:GTP-binding protein EngB required for normal cell division
MTSTESADGVQRQKTERFRVLIIGNANAGKTTILEKVCNAKGRDPIFLDAAGNKVRSVLSKSREWGSVQPLV